MTHKRTCVTPKGIMHHPPTWQRQRRLDSVGILRERFHTVGERREEASGSGKSCRVALVAWPLVALGLRRHWLLAPSPANSPRLCV